MSTKSIDQLLDLLIDALEERKEVRDSVEPTPQTPPTTRRPQPIGVQKPVRKKRASAMAQAVYFEEKPLVREREVEPVQPVAAPVAPVVASEADALVAAAPKSAQSELVMPVASPPAVEAVAADPVRDNMPRTLVQLFAALLLFIAFANLQLFDLTSLNAIFAGGNTGDNVVRFARDGMLLRGSGNAVYLMEDNKRRWITTAEAFNYYGYRWTSVRHVSDDYLAQFDEGDPIYLALKCPGSPHVFALDVSRPESTQRVRRWISDIETFEAMGFEWGDIDFNQCNMLRGVPNGEPFPADAPEPIPRP